MDVTRGYKQTDVGLVPKDWDVLPLSQVAPLQRGFDLPRSHRRDGPFPVVYSNGIENFHTQAMAKGPGVVTGRSGTLGRVHYVEDDYWPHNTSLWVTRFNKNAPRFVYHLYTAIRFERFGAGSGVPTLNRNDAHAFRVAIPTTGREQEAIAEALSDADVLIESLQQLIGKKRQIKQGAMRALLTGKHRLPGFTEEWKTTRLGTRLRFQVGFPFSSSFFNSEGSGVRLIRNRDLKSDDQAFFYSGEFDKTYLVRKGDVLIGMDGDFRPCLWVGELALLNQRVGRVLPLHGLDAKFSFYFLIEPLKEIENATSSTTVKHLSHGDVEGIEKPLPSIGEQTAIATVLSDMDTEIAALESRLAKTRDIKQGMMQALLTGRIRLI